MVDRHAAGGEHALEVAVADRELQVPPDRPENDLGREAEAAEGPGVGHEQRSRIGGRWDHGLPLNATEPVIGYRGEHGLGVGIVRVEPLVDLLGRKDEGHAVVDRLHVRVRFSRDDRERVEVVPGAPQTREGKRALVRVADREGLLMRPVALPFVEAGNRHDQATRRICVAKGRLLAHGLGAGVDHAVADLLVLRPMGDEAPAHESELVLVILDTDHRDALGRGDVVSEGQGKASWASNAKPARDIVEVVDVVEAATHNI